MKANLSFFRRFAGGKKQFYFDLGGSGSTAILIFKLRLNLESRESRERLGFEGGKDGEG